LEKVTLTKLAGGKFLSKFSHSFLKERLRLLLAF